MAAGDSIVGICNQALLAIGEDPITSLGDARKAAILCSLLYDPARRTLLESYPWKFAKKQANLAASTTVPLLDYGAAYPLPADFIRLISEPDNADLPDYEIMGGALLSNDGAPFGLLYVADCTDCTLFSPLFVKGLAYELAARLADALTQNPTKAAQMAQKVEGVIADARLSDSQQTISRDETDDVWLMARYGA